MRLDINSKYVITSDERNFIVNQRNIVKEGENAGNEYLLPKAYCSTLAQCLKWLVNQQVRKSDCTSIKELVALQQRINDEIDSVVNF